MSDQEPDTSKTAAGPTAPAGWYDDPTTGGRRWWDGVAWTEPPAVDPLSALPKPSASPLAIVALIVGGVAFLLGLVPVLGLILAIAGLGLGVFALLRKLTPTWMPAVGVAASAIAVVTSIIVLVSLVMGIDSAALINASASPSPSMTSPDATQQPSTPVTVPDVVGKTISEASTILLDAGLRTNVGGADNSWVVSKQDPVAGTSVDDGSSVQLTAAADFSAYDKLSKRDFAQMAKNPDAFAGRTLIIYGHVWQFDSATGTCNFLADTGNRRRGESYYYDATTWATGVPCSVLDPVVEDDHVELWVTVQGAYNYDTAAGGTNTAVSVDVQKVKILPHLRY